MNPSPASSSMSAGPLADDLLRTLWRRRGTFITAFLAVLAGVAAVTFSIPKSYEATSYVLVSSSNPPKTAFEGAEVSQALISTYGALLGAQSTREAIARDVPPRLRDDVLNAVSIEPVSDSQLLAVQATAGSPLDAQMVANRYAESSVKLAGNFGPEAAIAARLGVGANAALPTSASRPRPLLYLLVGALLAGLAGIAAATLRQRLDQRVLINDSAPDVLGLPVLSRIPQRSTPFSRNGDEHRDVATGRDGFRRLLANLALIDPNRRPSSVAVVSSAADEGRSSCAIGLARAAVEHGLKTLLVEGDLRDPSFATLLTPRTPEEPGLSDYLNDGGLSVGEVARTLPDELLRLAPAGPAARNPTALLGSDALLAFDEQARREFDLVVYDTAPLSAGADGSLVAGTAAVTILVIDARRSRRAAAERSLRELERARANVLGVVVNRATPVASGRIERSLEALRLVGAGRSRTRVTGASRRLSEP